MSYYVTLTCSEPSCRFDVTLSDGTEFFVDRDGRQLPYGRPFPLSREAEQAGVAGFWREWVCWACGALERETLQLPQPCAVPYLARQYMPLRDPGTIPRLCSTCGGILCDCEQIRVFVDYREDPKEVMDRLASEREELAARDPAEPADKSDLLAFLSGTCRETVADRIAWIEERLKELAPLADSDQMVLYRLGLPPQLPVSPEALNRLRALKREVLAAENLCRQAAGSSAAASKEASSRSDEALWEALKRVDSSWRSALEVPEGRNSAAGLLCLHVHLAERLAENPETTLRLFARRCPRCREGRLKVERHKD